MHCAGSGPVWPGTFLNGSKTKCPVVVAKWQLTKAAMTDISFGEWVKSARQIAKNIEGMMDLTYWLQERVKHRVSVSLLTTYVLTCLNTGKIRKHLVVKTTYKLVIPKLYYMKRLLHGLPACHLAKLQRVDNTAARVVSPVARRFHITRVLRALYWLPVKYLAYIKLVTDLQSNAYRRSTQRHKHAAVL